MTSGDVAASARLVSSGGFFMVLVLAVACQLDVLGAVSVLGARSWTWLNGWGGLKRPHACGWPL